MVGTIVHVYYNDLICSNEKKKNALTPTSYKDISTSSMNKHQIEFNNLIQFKILNILRQS